MERTDLLQRQRTWRSDLLQWADAQEGRPFVWGQTDCASLAREALLVLFGEALIDALPRWNSAREALTVLEGQVGVGRFLERLGATRTTVPFMRSGDILVLDEPEEEVGHTAVMVCVDAQRCLASLREGVQRSAPPPSAVVYSLWEVTWPK